MQLPTQIVDLNYFGILLEFTEGLTVQAEQYPRDLALHLEDEEGQFKIECLIFDVGSTQIRALFKHGSFEVAERLMRYIQRQKEAVAVLEAVS